VVLAAALLGSALVASVRQVRGSYWLERGLLALHEPGPGGAIAALPSLERARALAPVGYRVWWRSSEAALRVGRIDEATAAARRGLSVEPWFPNLWVALASAQLQAGDPRGAQDSAARALSLLPDLPMALATEAEAASAVGDVPALQRAREQLRSLAETPATDTITTKQARDLMPRVQALNGGN
jgi:predicted Zn-dependent protease